MNFGAWLGFIILATSLYVLWQVRQLLLLLFTAAVLANSLNGVIRYFQRLGLRRLYAVLLTAALLMIALLGFFWLVVPPFAEQFQELILLVPQGIDQLIEQLNNLKDQLSPELVESLPEIEQLAQQFQPLINQLLGGGFSFFKSSLTTVLSSLLLLALTFMLMADPHPYHQGIIRLFPSFYRRRAREILNLSQRALKRWMANTFLRMLVVALLSFIGLVSLGVPLALANAMLTGLLTFIPTIGLTVGAISPAAIALLSTPWKGLAVLVLYGIIGQLESHTLAPSKLALPFPLLPALMLLAQVFFARFFGVLGLMLALPLTIVAQVWIHEVLVKDILDTWEDVPPWLKTSLKLTQTGLIPPSNSTAKANPGSLP